MIGKITGITMWLIVTIAMAACILAWLFTLCMPYRLNFDCLGTLKSHEDGQFTVVNNKTHEVSTYKHKYVYETFEGAEKTMYMDSGTFDRWAYKQMRDNKWHFMYRYRWWTFHIYYLLASVVLFIIMGTTASAAMTSCNEVEAIIKARKEAKIKLKEFKDIIH